MRKRRPATLRGFMRRVGKPTLSFSIPSDGLVIPTGLLACCRVEHQPHCVFHVAGTVLGIGYTLTAATGESRDYQQKVGVPGDLLAYPNALWAQVTANWKLITARAEAAEAHVSDLIFGIWALSPSLWEDWSRLQQEAEVQYRQMRDEALVAGRELTAEQIEALPVLVISDEDEDVRAEQIAHLMAQTDWSPIYSYGQDVSLYPGELGHNAAARYVVGGSLELGDTQALPWMPEAS